MDPAEAGNVTSHVNLSGLYLLSWIEIGFERHVNRTGSSLEEQTLPNSYLELFSCRVLGVCVCVCVCYVCVCVCYVCVMCVLCVCVVCVCVCADLTEVPSGVRTPRGAPVRNVHRQQTHHTAQVPVPAPEVTYCWANHRL